jgi:ribonuclease PH
MVDCDVIEADGGTRTAAITGGWVALYDALTAIAGERSGDTDNEVDVSHFLAGQVAAVSVGIVDGSIVCDLDYRNDSRAGVDMNIVKRNEHYIEIQGTGERSSFSREEMSAMLDAADVAIGQIFVFQRRILEIE